MWKYKYLSDISAHFNQRYEKLRYKKFCNIILFKIFTKTLDDDEVG